MLPWIHLDTAPIPGGGHLRLLRRGTEFSINLDRGVLMSSRIRGSEEALARLGCVPVAAAEAPRILVGGFGMGFTLRAALDVCPPRADIQVAELIPGVIEWGRDILAPLSGNALADPRVTVQLGDVGALIRRSAAAFDAILLDVDNGPEGLTREENNGLYSAAGLRAAHRALRPAGTLSIWSAGPDAAFTRKLRQAGFEVAEVPTPAHGKRGLRHMIWVASRLADGRQLHKGDAMRS